MRLTSRRIDLLTITVLFAVNLAAIGPFLVSGFSSRPWNNDYIYLGEARVFRDFAWTWNPLQYAGVPFAYVYQPLFFVLMLAMSGASLGYAYHLTAGLGYALLPVAMYVLAVQLFRNRAVAAGVAAAFSLLPSPVCLLMPGAIPHTAGLTRAPWAFVTLTQYAEAPHVVALVLLLLLAAAAWSDHWRVAALLAGLICLLNWPGMVGMTIVLAAVAVGRSHDLGMRQALLRTVGVAGIGYGLAAFWITPGLLEAMRLLHRVVLRHELAPAPWGLGTWAAIGLGLALIGVSLHRRVSPSTAFVVALAAIPGAAMLAYAFTGSHVLPVPHRYLLELSAGVVLLIGAGISALGRWRMYALGVALLAGVITGWPFLHHAWRFEDRGIDPRTTAAWPIADWLRQHAGRSRVFTSGELEGSLNIWSDVRQVGGTHNGISNFLVVAAQKQISQGCGARVTELWLRALDAEYAVVHAGASREYFHWFAAPQKFSSLPVAWTNGSGDTIYRIPPEGYGSAVVVDLGAMQRLPPLRHMDDLGFLEAYVAWARGIRPARVHWMRPDTARIQTELKPNEAVLLKQNFDPGWHVSSGTTSRDPIGFLLVKPGNQIAELRFRREWLGRGITLLTLLLLCTRLRMHWIGAAAMLPAIAAFAWLASHEPATIRVAEEPFRNLHAPLINPGGIVREGRMISIYGRNFGERGDAVRVLVEGTDARIERREPLFLKAELPSGTPANAGVAIEVNGCTGNSFAVPAEGAASP